MILEILILFFLLFFMLIMFFLTVYVAVIGRLGLQIFRYNFPLLRKRGAHFLILQKDGRFKWVYKKFQAIWDWKDGSKAHISKKFDRISQSAEPLIFLIEGFPTNVKLFDQLTRAEISKFVNNINKMAYSTGRLVETDEEQKGEWLWKLIPIIGVILTLVTAIIALGIFLNIGELIEIINQIKPHLPAAIEAIKNAPREI